MMDSTQIHIRRPADGRRHGNQFYRAQNANPQMGETLCGEEPTGYDLGWADMARKREIPLEWIVPANEIQETPERHYVTCSRCHEIASTLTTEQARRLPRAKAAK